MAKTLVVEDDRNLLDTLIYNLRKEGHDVVTAVDGAEALAVARREKPDLIILDIMLPKLSGFEVCRILRKEMTTPILILTAKDEEIDKVVGLEIGADDYMTKPFSMRELLARLGAMLRRADISRLQSASGLKIMRIGDLEIDIGRHQVSHGGLQLDLTPKEYDLLVFLATNKGLVFSREQLLDKVWGANVYIEERTVDVHMRRLRKMLAPLGHDRFLQTVRGAGYRFSPTP